MLKVRKDLSNEEWKRIEDYLRAVIEKKEDPQKALAGQRPTVNWEMLTVKEARQLTKDQVISAKPDDIKSISNLDVLEEILKILNLRAVARDTLQARQLLVISGIQKQRKQQKKPSTGTEEAEQRARQEEEEAERKAREKEEAERKARQEEEAERKAREKEEAERKAREKEEAERKARQEEAERKAKQEEAEQRARKEEAERKARQEEAERKTRQEEAERKAREEEEAERKAREEEEINWSSLKASDAERLTKDEILTASPDDINNITNTAVLKRFALKLDVKGAKNISKVETFRARIIEKLSKGSDQTVEEELAMDEIAQNLADLLKSTFFDSKATKGLGAQTVIDIGRGMYDFSTKVYAGLPQDQKRRLYNAFEKYDIFDANQNVLAGLVYRDAQNKPVRVMTASTIVFVRDNLENLVVIVEDLRRFVAYYALIQSILHNLDLDKVEDAISNAFKGQQKKRDLQQKTHVSMSDNLFEKIQKVINALPTMTENLVDAKIYRQDESSYDFRYLNNQFVPAVSSVLSEHWDTIQNDAAAFDLVRTLRIHPGMKGVTESLNERSTSTTYIGANFECQTHFLKAIGHSLDFVKSGCNDFDSLDLANNHFKLYTQSEKY